MPPHPQPSLAQKHMPPSIQCSVTQHTCVYCSDDLTGLSEEILACVRPAMADTYLLRSASTKFDHSVRW